MIYDKFLKLKNIKFTKNINGLKESSYTFLNLKENNHSKNYLDAVVFGFQNINVVNENLVRDYKDRIKYIQEIKIPSLLENNNMKEDYDLNKIKSLNKILSTENIKDLRVEINKEIK